MKPGPKQQGMALIMLFFIVALAATGYLVQVLNSGTLKIEQDKKSAAALAEAKAALLGYVLTKTAGNTFGYLPNPDLELGIIHEGSEVGSTGSIDISLIGKLPWKTLGISPLRDGASECLWYVISGRFKNNPRTKLLNWDTKGQIDVIDGQGDVLAKNLAALLVAPGYPLGSQNRMLESANSIQCRGNYDVKNYLDPFSADAAISGEVNYFIGSTNNSRALDTKNKKFVLNKNNDYNDRFLFVSVDEIFKLINKRSDFAAHITSLLDDADFKAHLHDVDIQGDKGTDEVKCNKITNTDNQEFCRNWIEMLLLTELPVATPITIDGKTTSYCSRVLVFGGQRTGVQVRLTNDDKDKPVNYLEGSNLLAFDTPVANSSEFIGAFSFSASNPSADLLRCL